ncbi:hypothetical protein THI4931_15550 [Pandoraea sputorum]|nr:hypothetical protein THI4931_15550 [Pandoraea sputorum]
MLIVAKVTPSMDCVPFSARASGSVTMAPGTSNVGNVGADMKKFGASTVTSTPTCCPTRIGCEAVTWTRTIGAGAAIAFLSINSNIA